MIIIYKNIITNYVENKLSIKDINDFAYKNSIPIKDSESIIIYNYIKRNYKLLLNDKNYDFSSLKAQISPNLYEEIIKLYMKYKSKLF